MKEYLLFTIYILRVGCSRRCLWGRGPALNGTRNTRASILTPWILPVPLGEEPSLRSLQRHESVSQERCWWRGGGGELRWTPNTINNGETAAAGSSLENCWSQPPCPGCRTCPPALAPPSTLPWLDHSTLWYFGTFKQYFSQLTCPPSTSEFLLAACWCMMMLDTHAQNNNCFSAHAGQR